MERTKRLDVRFGSAVEVRHRAGMAASSQCLDLQIGYQNFGFDESPRLSPH